MGLPWKNRVKGGACAVVDATGGSALDCDLCAVKQSSAPLDGTRTDRLRVVPETA